MTAPKKSYTRSARSTPEARMADAMERIADNTDTYKKYLLKYLKWYLIGIFILLAIRILVMDI